MCVWAGGGGREGTIGHRFLNNKLLFLLFFLSNFREGKNLLGEGKIRLAKNQTPGNLTVEFSLIMDSMFQAFISVSYCPRPANLGQIYTRAILNV